MSLSFKSLKLALMLTGLVAMSGCSGGNYGDSEDSNTSAHPEIQGAINETGDRVFFALDSSKLDAESKDTLKKAAKVLKENTGVQSIIEGHADERGSAEYNMALGERRAYETLRFLVDSGVSSADLSATSYGKERPAELGHDEAAWSKNRRAVISVQ